MKYTLRYSGQFKRSYKLCKKRGYDMSKLETVLRLLAETGTLPPKYSAIETDIQKHSCDIYSLPGSGETQDISSNSAPRYSSRKYLLNDQVLIDSNERTYTVQGLEVK